MKLRIKEARKSYEEATGKKLTQEQLAEIVLKDRAGSIKSKLDLLNRMQAGRIAHQVLMERIAAVCGVDYNFLITQE